MSKDKDKIEQLQLEQLKETARILLRPMERLPFPVILEAMTGHQILPMTDSALDESLLNALASACIRTTKESSQKNFQANRPNDVSVQVERALQANMEKEGMEVRIPQKKGKGGGGGGGYPDRFLMMNDRPSYLEVKVSREQNINKGSARNFFYQPVSDSKITCSARHLLVGFAIREESEKMWCLTEWTIVDLFGLRLKLKPEYNADNLEIYRDEIILLKGNAKGRIN